MKFSLLTVFLLAGMMGCAKPAQIVVPAVYAQTHTFAGVPQMQQHCIKGGNEIYFYTELGKRCEAAGGHITLTPNIDWTCPSKSDILLPEAETALITA